MECCWWHAPVTVVAKGEFTVVHQKMHRFSRNAWDTDSSRNICRRGATQHPISDQPLQGSVRVISAGNVHSGLPGS
jgi:hypothetical protein